MTQSGHSLLSGKQLLFGNHVQRKWFFVLSSVDKGGCPQDADDQSNRSLSERTRVTENFDNPGLAMA
jgi:hypothetical protein